MLYKKKTGETWRYGGCVGCNRRWRGCFDDDRRSLCDTFGLCGFLDAPFPENNPREIWKFYHEHGLGPGYYPFAPSLIERLQTRILGRLGIEPQVSHYIAVEFPASVRLAVYPALRELAEADVIDAFVTSKGYCYHLKEIT